MLLSCVNQFSLQLDKMTGVVVAHRSLEIRTPYTGQIYVILSENSSNERRLTATQLFLRLTRANARSECSLVTYCERSVGFPFFEWSAYNRHLLGNRGCSSCGYSGRKATRLKRLANCKEVRRWYVHLCRIEGLKTPHFKFSYVSYII